jgi:hypothetical protein
MNQGSNLPPSFGGIGGQNTANLFAGLIQPQQAAPSPYQIFNAFHHAPGQQQSQPAANPLMGMMGGMGGGAPTQQQQVRPVAQPQTNAFAAMFGAPGGGAPGMGGMMGGPRPMNPMMGMMGMQQNPMMGGYMNSMAQMGMGGYGGYRMW